MLVMCVAVMGLLIVSAIAAPERFVALLAHPAAYPYARVIHVVSVTLFFANVVIGTLWETRALLTRDARIIRHTYATVVWLDGFFTAPLIIAGLVSGLTLATILGGVFSMGWLVLALALFVLSGILWVTTDIPSQYRVKKLFAQLPPDATLLPPELARLLRFRLRLNVVSIVPLFIVFVLMITKPAIPWSM